MSTYFEFWTEEMRDIATEELNWKLFEDFSQNQYQSIGTLYFSPITVVEDTAMAIFIFFLGTLLNAIILRNCWREKSTTSTYFRAFAVIDMSSVLFMLIRRVFLFVWPVQTNLIFFNDALSSLFAGLYNFGPMFLGMDRCLMVVFPHNFREHERKLRATKAIMVLVVTLLSLALSMLYRFGDPDSTATAVLGILAGFVAVLQIIVIVILYAVIVVKVLKSDQSMKNSRHIGNK